MIYLTRRAEFCASHRLHNPELSPEENDAVFGPCGNPHGHGHTYFLEVTVQGEIDPRTGMVMNLKTLKDIIQDHVVEAFDHRDLNRDVPVMAGLVPTAENIAVRIWDILSGKLGQTCQLYEVRLWETENSAVIYRG